MAWHVVLPGNTRTLEHHGTFRNTRKNPEHPQKTPEHPQKTQNTPKIPGHSLENQEYPKKSPEHPRKNPRNLKKQMALQYVTKHVSFSKLPPLIAHKIIWFDLHNLKNIYKCHTDTIFFLPASRFVMCP